MNTTFGSRLRSALDTRGPLCAGIDPHAALLRAWDLPDDVTGLERFALTAVEALGPRVAVLKPQSAFFERFGSRGIAVLERVIAAGREAGALVLLDAKRGDIGSTVQAYADAYLDPSSPLFADALTASPYLGFGSLQPLLDTAAKHGCGVFVLALTSNPEGPEVQAAQGLGGRTVAGVVLDHLAEVNADARPLGSIGAVVGATVGETGEDFARVNGPLLAPGLGAQGATADDLRRVFGAAVRNVVPATSRELLSAGPSVRALQDAADRTIESLSAVLR
ncbi:orotidine-5'-phosphate decarboxylase [Actinopolymorpha alba]|uniref:orotidine-5'-phosphate decarboxylase n=1 Tax=Actinopolymorpha alba TaxID=533267 RepID=UPI000362F69D|nr:orotidine-5'-phosphate decarboxylase [Actinopolymorpha alba]